MERGDEATERKQEGLEWRKGETGERRRLGMSCRLHRCGHEGSSGILEERMGKEGQRFFHWLNSQVSHTYVNSFTSTKYSQPQ